MSVRIINENLETSTAVDYGDYLEITINGKLYRYKPTSEFSVRDLVSKYNGIKKHSSGKALQWLKKNAKGMRVDVVSESLTDEEAKDIADFIMENTHTDMIDDLNIGDESREFLHDMYGDSVNYFTVDDTGIDSDVYAKLLDINNEDDCIWYNCYVEQIYEDENEEIIKIECGDYDLVLTVTDGFYQALNFGCTKEQLIGAIMKSQVLTEEF